MKRTVLLIVSLILFVVVFTSFAFAEDPVAGVPQVFKFGGRNDIMTLDVSQMNDEMSALIMYAINEGLIRCNKGNIIMGIAESYNISEDGTVYTFHLRDANWSDGVPVTADDFKYSFLRTLNPATGSSQVTEFDSVLNAKAYYTGEITDESKVGIKAFNDKTLVITLIKKDPFFLSQLAQGINYYPIRQDYVEKYGKTYASSPETFIGCGPFVLTKWVQAASLTMEKNTSYWDADSIKLDKVVELIIPDENTLVGMYDLGEVDAVYTVSAVQTVKHPNYGTNSGGTLQYLAFNNVEGSVMDNVNFSKALSFSIDRAAIVKAICLPGTSVIDRIIDPSIMLDGESIAKTYLNTTRVPENGDIEQAKAYLKQALSEMGLSSASDLPYIKYICMDSPTHKQYAEALQARWEETLDVHVDINILPIPQAIGALLSGEYDIFLVGQSTGVNPDTILKNFTIGNSNNYANWSNEEYTELINLQSDNSNLEERFSQLQQAEAIILDQVPVAPLWMPGSAYLYHDYVKGLYYGRETGAIEFIYTYIDK